MFFLSLGHSCPDALLATRPRFFMATISNQAKFWVGHWSIKNVSEVAKICRRTKRKVILSCKGRLFVVFKGDWVVKDGDITHDFKNDGRKW